MWRVKVLVQFVLARLPGGESINFVLQRARGAYTLADLGGRLMEVAKELARLDKHVPITGATIVEVGTGWDAIAILLFHMMGAREVWSYDIVRHARYCVVKRTVHVLGERLKDVSAITGVPLDALRERHARFRDSDSLEDLFTKAGGIHYIAPGSAVRTGLPEASVDLFYSHDVLEHVPQEVISDLAMESRRLLKPSGIAYHTVGIGDHYGNRKNVSYVNFLKYSDRWWDFWVQNKLSYHNRLREKEFIHMFSRCGGEVRVFGRVLLSADLAALSQLRIDKRFAGMTPEELAVAYSEFLVTFPPKAAE